jgi:threonine/homoserine/homoserine lactone efflux protein
MLVLVTVSPYQGLMTQSFLFLRGLAIGFALAAPLGPVGVLCIRRALAVGRAAAFVAGLGAALADTIFGAMAGLGLTFISSFLLSHQLVIRLIGGSFLILLGVRGWRDATPDEAPQFNGGLMKDFVATFLLTLSNPATILAAFGVFAALGAIDLDSPSAASLLILGVFFGSTLWWLILAAAAGALRSRCTPQRLRLLNRLASLLLLLLGSAILVSAALGYLRK